MSIKDRVLRTLRTDAMRHIYFTLGGLTIRSQGYGRVIRAIDDGRIEIRFVRHLNSTVPPGCPLNATTPAVWDMENDCLWFNLSKLDGDVGSGIIVHECTHALIDLMKCAGTTNVTSEVAAYFAECIWLNARGQNMPNNCAVLRAAYAYLRALNAIPPASQTGGELDHVVKICLTPAMYLGMRIAVLLKYPDLRANPNRLLPFVGLRRPARR